MIYATSFLYDKNKRKDVYVIAEKTTASDKPTKPYKFPNTSMNNDNDDILIMAETPTDVCPFNCSFALNIDDNAKGSEANTII